MACLLVRNGGSCRNFRPTRDIIHNLDVSLNDVVHDQAGEIEVEPHMSISKNIDEGLDLAGDHNRTCGDPLPTVENDRLHLVDIIGWMGLVHIDGLPEVCYDCHLHDFAIL